MNIRSFEAKDKTQWNRYVMGADASSCYHLIGWKDVIEKSLGNKTYYLLAEDSNNTIIGILPLVHLKSVLFGNYMVSIPYFNYGGVCGDSDEICGQLFNKAVNIAQEQDTRHIEFRHTHHINNMFKEKTSKVSMRLELPSESEQLLKSLPSKLRSQIRRPTKEGMYSKIGKEEELDSFYTVFSINMRDLGTPVYSKEFFRDILTTFPDAASICTVYAKDGNPAASGFLIGFKEMLEIPWASSLRRYNRQSPNMLLYWESLKFACENGYKQFDFGRSTPGEGTYKFKKQWGAKPLQLYWHYWLKNGRAMPELNPHNPKYKMAINIWQNLPVWLTKIIGPTIVKNLP